VSILCPSVMNRCGLWWILCNGLPCNWLILLLCQISIETTDQKVGSSNLLGRTRNSRTWL
jgi:hypothetical protein